MQLWNTFCKNYCLLLYFFIVFLLMVFARLFYMKKFNSINFERQLELFLPRYEQLYVILFQWTKTNHI